MNLVDSSGWLEYFIWEKNSPYFAPVILALRRVGASKVICPSLRACRYSGRIDSLSDILIEGTIIFPSKVPRDY
jgi:hypothetical protein